MRQVFKGVLAPRLGSTVSSRGWKPTENADMRFAAPEGPTKTCKVRLGVVNPIRGCAPLARRVPWAGGRGYSRFTAPR